MGTRLAPTFMKNSVGEILYDGIRWAQRNPVPLVIIVEMLTSIWRERNAVQYRGDKSQIPIHCLLAMVEAHGRALMDS